VRRCTRRQFHLARVIFWTVQVPPAVLWEPLRESLPYIVFLSLAALIESSFTDYDQAREAERKAAKSR
jgi:hypothetical protein